MPKKYDSMRDIFKTETANIVKNPENWMSFLHSACRNYRLPFDAQVMIHAQRPEATAVLEIERWNKLFNRRVNRGAKGIAVFDREHEGSQRLKYYFDISDTSPSYYSESKPVWVWTMENRFETEVMEGLEAAFGELENKSDLAQAILSVASNTANDNMTDYYSELSHYRKDSFLEELDEYNVEVMFRNVLTNSIAYMLMTRCGINAGDYFEPEDFTDIMNFNTNQTLTAIGTAVSDVAEMGLRDISTTIRSIQISERKQIRTIDKPKESGYDEENQKKGLMEYDRDSIHHAGRLPVAEPDHAGRTGSTAWEVRITPQEVSETAPQSDVQHPVDGMHVEPTPDGSRGTGTGENGTADQADGRETGSDGGTQGSRPNEMGGVDKQHPTGGRGSGTDRDNLQLTWHDRETEDNNLPFFSSDYVNDILHETPFLSASKREIKDYFALHEDKGERTEYIKSIFNNDCTEITIGDEHRVGYKTYQNVLHLWEGSFLKRTSEAYYDWGVIIGHIEGMILLNEWGDTVKPLPSIDGQMSLLEQVATERATDFTFSQEVIDHALKQGSGVEHGKYRIYSYFLQGHTARDKEAFLSKEYGAGSRSAISTGVDIGEYHDGKGIKLHRGYGDNAPKLLLGWNKVAKRIGELIATGRYMSNKELEYIPEYEKGKLARGIYHFYYNQPEEVARPYEYLSDYYQAIGVIRPQLEQKERIAEILDGMAAVLDNTADFDGHYESMQRAYNNLLSYQNGTFSLFTEIPVEETNAKETQTIETDITEPATDLTSPYDLSMGTEVYIGTEHYEILSISDDTVTLQDLTYPILMQTLERAEFDRKVRENPANDHLKVEAADVAPGKEKATDKTNNGNADEMIAHAERVIADYPIDLTKERFEITTTSDAFPDPKEAYAIWDNIRDGYYADDYGKIPTFPTEGEALKGLGEVRKAVASKEVMEWLYTERAKGTFAHIKELPNDVVAKNEQEAVKNIPLGAEIDIQDRKFTVDSINYTTGTVSLKDITFQGATGFPIFRNESVDFVRGLLEQQAAIPEQESEELVPTWEKPQPTGKTQSFDLHPEVPPSERNQYRISNDELGHGTPKEKFRTNLKAIEVLKQCEEEHRFATKEEQETLSAYVGWGGLPDVFDDTKTAWTNEYTELKRVLSDEEYTAARESTLTAFYTPPTVIRSIYQALENMGLKSGNILEPSCGIGHFIGMKPESLSDCKLYGVEVDGISGRIAQQLYQQSTIAVQGFENANLPDSFFDVAVGNVPFGQFKLSDKRYDKHNFLIHDYFFSKTLDKVRPGGIIAFITSSGTMDKKNPAVRKYIAQRAELLGAIRLPNNTFQKNAGTMVTSDILFLQKRDRMMETEPDWVHLGTDENGIAMNRYFVEHPEMILGEMVMETTRYGPASTCKPYEDNDLEGLLSEAVQNIHADISDYEIGELEDEDNSIPADPSVKNFSYTVVDGQVYYRENSRMTPIKMSVTASNRVKDMIAIRDCTRTLIEYQTKDYPDKDIRLEQVKLNALYEIFQKQYGLINSRANQMAFSEDYSYPLLCSLEVLNGDGTLKKKADMFTKRTIKPNVAITKADTASEALAVSLSERACVDMDFMCSLTGKTPEEIEKELTSIIFRLPAPKEEWDNPHFVSADEYLSGNVREKLRQAKIAAETSELYKPNVDALEKVQPKDLSASEISVRLGTTWIPAADIEKFMFQLLDTPWYAERNIKVHYSQHTSEWNVEGKTQDRDNVKANNTYGTKRANAYQIIEESLNLKDVRIMDYFEDENGKRKGILNKKETALAQGKQELIKQAFSEWIWENPERRQRLTKYYNEHFNATRAREYDGSHLTFGGINPDPEIELRQHQKNAVARHIYGGNSLFAHVVGAGKTYAMIAAAMESKRLGLCHKSMVVVPNHIIEQFAADWLQLYPAANILVSTKKDFETKNRKKFCARIATGEYDGVIIGHSQFEKIPISPERGQRMIEGEIREIMVAISELKQHHGNRYSIKQLERSRKSLMAKLEKLNDQSRKDDVIYFEELGVDRLFVDEADFYKNLFLYTKMRNVGGIAQTEAQKSSDMYMKCRYMDEITGGRGIVFATGTPVSNSMTELYTMQRYLQYDTLRRHNLQNFDSWASTFGETVTAIELAPEGTGYRVKTRFAQFFNLPELMTMFKEVADIQTADMLNLPVPKANYNVVTVKPSEIQRDMVANLAIRAERVRNGMVDSADDNMLLITNDGRKLALDQRLMNELLPDEKESKVNACANEVYRFWDEGKEKKLTQLVFCDMSTPKKDGEFSVYNDLKNKMVAKGIPPEEIVFIHEADNEKKKKELFAKVRNGSVRVLIGSTFKMGAGMNVQDLLIAIHDLDPPWRPRDLEQRGGRIIRQGNKNKEVHIIRYVTESTFDSYMYQTIENKQKFIAQIMTSKSPARSAEDIDETALSYAEIKALATGNPYIKEKMSLDIDVSKLKLFKQNFLSQKYELEDKVTKTFPSEVRGLEERITGYEADIAKVKANTPAERETFPTMQIKGVVYTDKAEAGKAIIKACKEMSSPDDVSIGTYRGLSMTLSYHTFAKEFFIKLKGDLSHLVTLGTDIHGNITRLDHAIAGLDDKLQNCKDKLENTKLQLENAKKELEKPFPKEKELEEKTVRLAELDALLDMGEKDTPILDEKSDENNHVEPKKKVVEWER